MQQPASSSDELIADSKSGVSGAGRNPSAGTHFPETADGLHAYKTLAHRHAPEMGRMLDGMNVRFVPHLVPLIRGILSTVYLRLKPGVDEEQVRRIYEDAYGEEPFVHVLDAGLHPDPRHVRGTNRCHLGSSYRVTCLSQSAIDNLCKGSSGKRQCLLDGGLPETEGLMATAVFP